MLVLAEMAKPWAAVAGGSLVNGGGAEAVVSGCAVEGIVVTRWGLDKVRTHSELKKEKIEKAGLNPFMVTC